MIGLIQDWWFDHSLGVRTEGRVPVKDLGIPGEHPGSWMKYRRYQATRVRAFRKLMRALALPKEHVFVDLGSGMGRMLLLAMEYGFVRAVGVEISGSLCQIARENVATYRKNHPARTQVEIVESDVAAHEIQEDESVYFLYNPFNDEVMRHFFNKLRRSIQRKDREVWIIYNNPVFQEVIDSLDFIEQYCTFVYGGSTFHIYRHPAREKDREAGQITTPFWGGVLPQTGWDS